MESRRKLYDKNVEEKRVNQMVFWNSYGSLEYQRVKVHGFIDCTNKTKVNGPAWALTQALEAEVTYLINDMI